MANENINPWLRLWVHPKKTIRSIIDSDPRRVIVWLAIIGGMISALSWIGLTWLRFPDRENVRHAIFIVAMLVSGGVIGILHLYFGGWLYRLTGSWIGGKGSFTDVKCAIGWANYPFIISGILAAMSYYAVPHFWFMSVIGLTQLTAFVWAFVILLNLVAEAHRFTVFRAFCTLLIGLALIFVALLIIGLLVPLLHPLFR